MEIVTYPDPILTKKAEPVEHIDQDIQDLIENMGEMMYRASGIGLAANQVGVAKQVFVYDLRYRERGRNLNVLINPTIVLAEENIDFEEGCLSVPDFLAKTTRRKYLKAKGLDRDGKPIDIEAEDLLAICIQHEIDHLNGTLILDHVSHLKRDLYKRRIRKLMKRDA
ncbi:MAG: peptide deformylase [Deltaproteobacteria bacterium]|nr:peptide deformylase [Deltaproteobacteria bacterium]MBW2077496.1 peptide deformylase [Deltaproteobacteria bacterium]MBW2309775.1 peptide deformylase [Deltaproteobacteria bacterium]